MTCIVGLVSDAAVYIGGDSQESRDWDMWLLDTPKVFRVGEMVLGCAGSPRMAQLLQYELKPEPQTSGDNFAYLVTAVAEQVRTLFKDKGFLWVENEKQSGGEFLIGYRGRVYIMWSDFGLDLYKDEYLAIGCGANYAMGALYANKFLPPKKRIKQALKASAHFSNGVSGPFHILEV